MLYNLLIQEHCRLVVLERMSIFCKPTFSKFLYKGLCLILGIPPDQVNSFPIFCSPKIIVFGIAVTKASFKSSIKQMF